MPIYKKINKDFFKSWSSEMAYVLGFFMADGSIDVNPRGSHYFSIQICDKNLLYDVKNSLDSDHKISIRKGTGKERDRYRLQIGSKEMCNDLRLLGVNENKTYHMGMPSVPKKYIGDFIRGYFDGDGNVWVGKIHKERKKQNIIIQSAFTSCSKKFLCDLYKILKKFDIQGGSLRGKKNYFRLSFGLKDTLLLYKIMYNNLNNESLLLERKRKIFENFSKMRS